VPDRVADRFADQPNDVPALRRAQLELLIDVDLRCDPGGPHKALDRQLDSLRERTVVRGPVGGDDLAPFGHPRPRG
jgi:hypothetical protein